MLTDWMRKFFVVTFVEQFFGEKKWKSEKEGGKGSFIHAITKT